jgi:ribosomal protein L20
MDMKSDIKNPEQMDAEKRKKMIDEIYGYSEAQEEEDKEKKSQLMELINSYAEHRKQKQQQPLKSLLS